MVNREKQKYGLIISLQVCVLLLVRTSFAVAEISMVNPAPDSLGKNIFIQAKTGKAKVYKGEPVTVSYLLYHRVPVIDPQNEIRVKFEDCEVEAFPVTGASFTEKLNGQVYQVILLKKLLVIPQQPGTIKVPVIGQAFKMNAPPDPDDFFGVERIVTTQVTSQPLMLPVLPLPAKKDSAVFSGAIGKFTFKTAYTPDAKHPNLLNFTFKVSGTGNLKGVNFTSPGLPAGTEIFNETSTGSHTLGRNELKAEHQLSYQIMANYRGNYSLPAFSFLYFDPDKAAYVNHQVPAFEWQVKEGPMPPKIVTPQKNKSPDNNFTLYTKNNLRAQVSGYFVAGTSIPLLLLLASGLCFIGGLLVSETVRRRELDPGKYNFRNAGKKALKQIRKLKNQVAIQKPESMSRSLALLLKEYLAAKCFRSASEINLEILPVLLRENKIPEHLIKQTAAFLERQYALRFSGVKSMQNEKEKYLQEIAELIKEMEPWFNGKVTG